MNYPELLLFPIVMVLDYFLTIAGRIQHEKEYAKHFKIESYELNPAWQSDVANTRWINPRHLSLVLLVTVLLVWILEFREIDRFLAEFILGLVLVYFAAIVGRHLANIAMFVTLARNPQLVSGQVMITQRFGLVISMWQTCALLVPLLALLLISPSASVAGGISGALCLFVVHFIWLLRQPTPPATDAPESD